MKLVVAFDHRGMKLREPLLAELDALGHEVLDLGTDSPTPRIDYPDKARELGGVLQEGGADRGVLVCGSGVGASARQGVQHDDMNVLCLGSEIVGEELALELVRAFAGATFDGGERYVRRLEKVQALEEEVLQHG